MPSEDDSYANCSNKEDYSQCIVYYETILRYTGMSAYISVPNWTCFVSAAATNDDDDDDDADDGDIPTVIIIAVCCGVGGVLLIIIIVVIVICVIKRRKCFPSVKVSACCIIVQHVT